MNPTRIAACLVIIVLLASGLLPFLGQVGGYHVNGFSDGSGEKDIVFTPEITSDTVFISVPRATNLSEAQIEVSAGVSSVSDSAWYTDFSQGTAANLSRQDGLRLNPIDKWYNTSWAYRLPISVDSSSRARSNITVDAKVNLSAVLDTLGHPDATLDEKSLRIVEYNDQGNPIIFNGSLSGPEAYEVPMSWDKGAGYDATANALVDLTWLVNGPTLSNTVRKYCLYFDESANGPKPAGKATISYSADIVFSNWAPPENFGLLYKNNDMCYTKTQPIAFATHYSAAVDSGDFNGDGYPDLVFANWFNGTSYEIDSEAFAGGPDGVDNATGWFLPTCGTFGLAVGDVNSDGIDDIIFPGIRSGSNYTIGSRLYYGSLNGPDNSTPVLFYTEGATDAAVADFNNDGKNDIVFACAHNGSSGNINSFIYLNNGNGFNSVPDILLPTQNAYAVEAADLNKDGWQDLVFANRRNTSISGSSQYEIDSFVYYGSSTGFKSTPDVRLPTHGALDAKIADLDNDGWLDIIFANYNDGATYNTMSQAYLGSSSGFTTTPGSYFQTSWAYGVDTGDIDNDGILEVAFANYYNGVTPDINSTVFDGPCIGLQQPDIFLPTHGANDVHIFDDGRYYMSKDKNPPIITPGDPEGRYLPSGTYTSTVIPLDEKILSASAEWNSTIPAAPAGCTISVYLSNDAGATWTRVQPGVELDFTTAGKSLRYKVELFSDQYGVETPVFQDITITYTKESYPYNVKLDINSDGREEWSWPGKFNGTAVLNETTMGLKTWLEQVVPRVGSGLFTVPLKFSSERPGILRVYGLNITGNYRPEALFPISDIVMTENIPLVNAFNVNNYFRHLDEDKLQYITIANRNIFLNISDNGSVTITSTLGWYGEEHFILRAVDASGEWADIPMDVEVRHVAQPPYFSENLPDVTVEEGDTVFSAFNLLEYVFDPDNPRTSLIFSVADVSNPNVSVSMDVNDNIEVRSKAGWDGLATVKIKVSDGELSAISPFNVTVVRHNRPPVVTNLPPVQLEQDSSLDRSFNMYNFTTDTDTPKANLTFRIDDNTNPKSGVSIGSDGWVNIHPDKGWSGTALVFVNVSDGEFGVRSSFTVTVTPKAVTPKPVTTTDNTMVYLLMALVVILLVFLAVDIGMRMRKPAHPVQYVQAPPEAQAPGPTPVRKARVQPATRPDGTLPAEASQAGTEPVAVEVQALPPTPEIPAGTEAPPAPQEASAPPAQESFGMAGLALAGQPATAPATFSEKQYDFSQAEMPAGTTEGGVAPMPSVPEAPPESVPDVTPPAAAPDAGEWHAEPVTMEMEQQAPPAQPAFSVAPPGFAGALGLAPAPEIGAGEVDQRPAGASAASLLASLQKPVPKLESEAAAAPPPSQEAPAQPAPAERAEPSLVSKATEGENAPAEVEQKDMKPITRVRCAGCKSAIPIFSAQRPLVVTCPQCGRMGMLK